MLSTVILIVTLSPEILGAVVSEKSLDDHRNGKGQADDAVVPVEEYRGGNLNITGSGGRFFNPQWDAAEGRQSPRLLNRYYFVEMDPDADVEFIRFTLADLEMLKPVDGDCINDKLEIFNSNSESLLPSNFVLCGSISNQGPILIRNIGGPFEILLKVLPYCQNTGTRFGRQRPPGPGSLPRWDAKIEYLPYNFRGNNGDVSEEVEEVEEGINRRRYSAPQHCLQYHTATSGTIKSFNYGGDMLNNMDYSICFGYEAGRYCGVEFTFTKLDLGNFKDRPLDALLRIAYGTRDTRGCMTTTTRRRPPPNNNGSCDHDYLLIGGKRHCGDYTDYHVTAYGRSPLVVHVVSGMSNRFGEKGFYANYRMLGC